MLEVLKVMGYGVAGITLIVAFCSLAYQLDKWFSLSKIYTSTFYGALLGALAGVVLITSGGWALMMVEGQRLAPEIFFAVIGVTTALGTMIGLALGLWNRIFKK